MRSKTIQDSGGQTTHVLVFETGDEAAEGLRGFVESRGISAAHFTAIGALSEATLGYFDWESKQYREIPIREQVEVLSMIGDVAEHDGKPKVHAHLVLGRSDGSTRGGHLISASVRPTLEVMLVESPSHLRKVHDPESGLALIRP